MIRYKSHPSLSHDPLEISGPTRQAWHLAAARAQCELTGATLIVAKLDRLSRNVAFLATLQDAGAQFLAADMPEANELNRAP